MRLFAEVRLLDGEVTLVKEEYLENIYRLEQKSGAAKTSQIVEALKVTPGTVTNTIERLEKEGLVTHEPYRGVKLTGKGLRLAQEVIRRHRLSERLLTDVIGVDWTEAHSHACKLEHGIAGDVADRLEKALNNPGTCPHGNPIPSKSGEIEEEESLSLNDASVGRTAQVAKITEEDAEMLRYLASRGLMPGVTLTVVEKAPFEGPITVRVDGRDHAIGRRMASVIWVKQSMAGLDR
ncbi:MAG: metal-dependent transcriptional regulator [Candidatus Bathyarchaeia archaeon]